MKECPFNTFPLSRLNQSIACGKVIYWWQKENKFIEFHLQSSLTDQPCSHTKHAEKFLSVLDLLSIDSNDNKGSVDFYCRNTLAFFVVFDTN